MTAEEDVDRLLRAAAAPGRPEELAGEQRVLAAFRQAHLADAPMPRRQSMVRLALAKLLTAKVAAVTVAVGAAGGAALAATGNLPGDAVGGLGTAPATVQPSEPATTPPVSRPAGGEASEHPRHGSPGHGPLSPPASPAPSIEGLCQAYVAGAGDRERAKAHPAFRGLISRAGGEDEVADYCEDLLPSPPVPGGRPSSGPPGERPDAGRTPPADPGPPGDRVGPPSVPPTGR